MYIYRGKRKGKDIYVYTYQQRKYRKRERLDIKGERKIYLIIYILYVNKNLLIAHPHPIGVAY